MENYEEVNFSFFRAAIHQVIMKSLRTNWEGSNDGRKVISGSREENPGGNCTDFL